MKKQFLLFSIILFASFSFGQIWTKTSTFTNPVNAHTVTVLGNGDVLQVGGDHGFNAYSNDVNIYNIESDTWTAVAPYPTNIQYHTAFATSATTVIVFGGGIDGTSTDLTYEYNSETDVWSAKASLPEPLEAISATKLQDGRIFITGGWALPAYSCNDNAYIYDAAADTWTTVASMPEELTNTACVLLGNGDVVVAGGVNSSFTTSSGSYVYNIENNTWTTAGSLPYALSGINATGISNGKVALVGGFDFGAFTYYDKVLIFDTTTLVWTELLTLSTSISNCFTVGFDNNTMLIAGGNNDAKQINATAGNITISMLKGITNNDTRESLNVSYIIDFETGTADTEDALPETRQAPAGAVLNDGRVIITGGAGEFMADDSYNDGVVYEKSLAPQELVVLFTIVDVEANAIENATVLFNELNLTTNSLGQVSTSVSFEGGTFGYTVQKEGFDTVVVTSTDDEAIVVDGGNVEKTVVLTSTVGISTNPESFELTIYPTITSGNITIVGSPNKVLTLKIINQLGQIVEIISNVEGTRNINLNLKQGIYIIVSEDNMKNHNVQKLIIQ
ncbi:MAG: kelch repeat-containing protein [Salinivirgaceae bacterium]|nr:kelch repeat-containing protein [Salinivirgaceae bacterium]